MQRNEKKSDLLTAKIKLVPKELDTPSQQEVVLTIASPFLTLPLFLDPFPFLSILFFYLVSWG